MDWKQRRAKLRELGTSAREQPEEVASVVASSIEAIDEELDRLHKSVAHILDRLEVLSNKLATIEARVHEDVE